MRVSNHSDQGSGSRSDRISRSANSSASTPPVALRWRLVHPWSSCHLAAAQHSIGPLLGNRVPTTYRTEKRAAHLRDIRYQRPPCTAARCLHRATSPRPSLTLFSVRPLLRLTLWPLPDALPSLPVAPHSVTSTPLDRDTCARSYRSRT